MGISLTLSTSPVQLPEMVISTRKEQLHGVHYRVGLIAMFSQPPTLPKKINLLQKVETFHQSARTALRLRGRRVVAGNV